VREDPEILLPKDAADLLLIAEATLAKMRCLGGGPPYIKMGRLVRYLRPDCLAWRDARRVKNTSDASRLPPRLVADEEATAA
jgi:hypothetical protein